MEFDLFERYYQAIHTTNNGYHRYLYSKVLRTGNYLDMEYKRTENGVTKFLRHTIKVDDHETLVNFGRRTPDFLLDQQFYLGIAHQGFHVFMGSYGEVIEGHSKGKIDDELALERSYFNPLNDGTDYFKLLVTDNDKNFLYKNHIGKPSRLPTEQEYGKAVWNKASIHIKVVGMPFTTIEMFETIVYRPPSIISEGLDHLVRKIVMATIRRTTDIGQE